MVVPIKIRFIGAIALCAIALFLNREDALAKRFKGSELGRQEEEREEREEGDRLSPDKVGNF